MGQHVVTFPNEETFETLERWAKERGKSGPGEVIEELVEATKAQREPPSKAEKRKAARLERDGEEMAVIRHNVVDECGDI